MVDFDITRTTLIPVRMEDSPFEVILEENHRHHKLQFIHRQDLFKFQQALTGYKAMDKYTGYVPALSGGCRRS